MKHVSKLTGGLAVAVLLAFTPVKANAQLLLQSSMTAQCLDPQCTLVAFVMNVDPDVNVGWVRFQTSDISVWRFGTLVSVTDAQGNPVTWNPTVYPDSLRIDNTGPWTPEPITIVLEMAVSSTPNQLHQLSYVGLGRLVSDHTVQTKFEGSVVPEPTTVILLGSGLLGLGAARRRRRRLKLGDDT